MKKKPKISFRCWSCSYEGHAPISILLVIRYVLLAYPTGGYAGQIRYCKKCGSTDIHAYEAKEDN